MPRPEWPTRCGRLVEPRSGKVLGHRNVHLALLDGFVGVLSTFPVRSRRVEHRDGDWKHNFHSRHRRRFYKQSLVVLSAHVRAAVTTVRLHFHIFHMVVLPHEASLFYTHLDLGCAVMGAEHRVCYPKLRLQLLRHHDLVGVVSMQLAFLLAHWLPQQPHSSLFSTDPTSLDRSIPSRSHNECPNKCSVTLYIASGAFLAAPA
mmetsp:Transcript_67896/g.106077  ORF Transcript_67896/g.106077 Transcript_67896/m.106077 type:complete len:203 (-) Transcript_67896:569-1177(-)